MALQAIHEPFSESILVDSEMEYHAYCNYKTYGDSFLNNENHKNVCGEMIDVDRQFDMFVMLSVKNIQYIN